MSKRRWILVGLAVAAFLAVTFLFIQNGILQLKIAFAEDQVATFYEMVDRATDADAAEAAASMQYVKEYYPSGTKQAVGTRLDVLVESVRDHCVDQIIDRLRTITGEDLGDDSRAWIDAYAKE